MAEYTATTSPLYAPGNGMIRMVITGTVGTVSVDEWISGAYAANPDLTFTSVASKVITLDPLGKYRLTITGGTGVSVKIRDMGRHTA